MTRFHRARPILGTALLTLAAGVVALTVGSGMGLGFGVASDGPEVVIGHLSYAFDPTDDRRLAGVASDSFVGRVVARPGAVGAPTSIPGQEVPQTQIAVEVIQAVKGTAAGTVTVNQVGGLDSLSGKLFLLEGDPLLRPGGVDLFVVLWIPEHGRYQILAAGYGHPRARAGTERTRVIERFARAAGVPIPTAARPTPRTR